MQFNRGEWSELYALLELLDNQDLLKQSISSAADSITPIFVKEEKDIESALDKLNEQLQNHPDIILLKQKIKAEEEIRNKHIDQNETGEILKNLRLVAISGYS